MAWCSEKFIKGFGKMITSGLTLHLTWREVLVEPPGRGGAGWEGSQERVSKAKSFVGVPEMAPRLAVMLKRGKLGYISGRDNLN